MAKLYFNTGQVRELSEEDLKGFMKRLANFNIRYFQSRENGDLIFMDNAGMAWLERELPDEQVEKAAPKETPVTEEPKEVPEVVEEKAPDEDPAVTAMRELTEKSDCHKNGHAGQNQIIYKQMLKTKHGSSERYFPVCEFCGFKGRFIAKDKLSDEMREAAKLYEG